MEESYLPCIREKDCFGKIVQQTGPYSKLATGSRHTVLLRVDGTVIAKGLNEDKQLDVPPLDGDLRYTQVAAGEAHTVVLRSDGTAAAYGSNDYGQCDLPSLDHCLSYTQVAAGSLHTVLLRSDGKVVICGQPYGRILCFSVDSGLPYVQVAAGGHRTVFLRSDGKAVALKKRNPGRRSSFVGEDETLNHFVSIASKSSRK